jgi:hypothetical protein
MSRVKEPKIRTLSLVWGSGDERTEEEVLSGFTSDEAVIEQGDSVAADHVAGHLLVLSGLALPTGFRLADAVIGRGGQRVHYLRGEKVWAVDAEALMIHHGLTDEAREIAVYSIRTAHGRMLRTSKYAETIATYNRRLARALTSVPKEVIRTTAPVRLDPLTEPGDPWIDTFAPGYLPTTQGPSSHWPRRA